MSHFTESQFARLCAAVDKYAQQQINPMPSIPCRRSRATPVVAIARPASTAHVASPIAGSPPDAPSFEHTPTVPAVAIFRIKAELP